ncbi:response regulator transcription factor [Alicyclobacillus tolerans]|uniref:response regulator transcription factor n=1 Tax=Alicyclobacillus tolerans TaxID=90970 RepID=UPI001F2C31D4|nr:response regulator transcription factor [Alicyclobacillus tolerans]MCF8564850.1 response regulator transcription factor [Alicyclobacillus tolerans]
MLMISDDERVRETLRPYLIRDHLLVEERRSEQINRNLLAQTSAYSLVLVDPQSDVAGWNICSQIRKYSEVPLIFISDETLEEHVVKAFELGADDVVRKPFSPRELDLRIQSLLRRSRRVPFEVNSRQILEFGDLKMDLDARTVVIHQTKVQLTPKEFDLIAYLAQHPKKVCARHELLHLVWHRDKYVSIRTVDTHVKRIRQKFYDISPKVADYLKTVWRIGYKFDPNPEVSNRLSDF